MSSNKKLTDKQELFCQEYIKDQNATKAAIRSGYNENTASRTGSENLSKHLIKARLNELMRVRRERLEIDQDFVVNNLIRAMKICTGEEDTHIIGSDKGTTIEMSVKRTDMANFVKIQDMFFKHIGGYEKDNEQKSSQVTVFELPSNNRK